MGPTRPLITKIAPPELPEVVWRQTLFELLDRSDHYSVTWVSATAGSGKTTLAASYLAHQNLPFLWYRFDEGDSDLTAFFHYLGLAAEHAVPDAPEPLPPFTPAVPGAKVFAMRFFEKMGSRLPLPFVMVFDDFQLVEPFASMHDVLKKGLFTLPRSVHVLVLSRTDPPAAFASLIAKNRMRIIDANTMRLSPDESKAIIELETGRSLSQADARQLCEKAQGWATGLVLLAKNIREGKQSGQNSDPWIPSALFDYFSSELFERMDETVRNCLLKMAFLPQTTVAMAQALTGRSDTEQILQTLQRNNIFTEKTSDDPCTYTFHELFRIFLISKAMDLLGEKEILVLKRRAAAVLAEAGRVEEAADLFVDVGDMQGFVQLIQSCAMTLIRQGRSMTLEGWLQNIPEDILAEHPWLLYWRGVARQHHTAPKAWEDFVAAFYLFGEQHIESGRLLSWVGIVQTIVIEWNDFNVLDPWIEFLEERTRSGSAYPSAEIEGRVAVCMMVALLIRKPGTGGIDRWVQKALSFAHRCGDMDLYLYAIDWVMTYHAWMGRFDQVEVIRKESKKLARSHGTLAPMVIHWRWIDISTRLCTMNGLDTIPEEVTDAIELANRSGCYAWEHRFLMAGIFAALVQSKLKSADAFMKRFEALLDSAHYHGYSIYHHFAGLNQLLAGNVAQAQDHSETALQIAEETGYVLASVICRIQLAYVLHLRGASDAALEALQIVDTTIRPIQSAALEFMSLLVNSKMAYDRGDDCQGLLCLKKGLALGRRYRFWSMVWWWHPGLMSYLCAQALVHQIETDYVVNLIHTHHLLPQAPFSDIENWPWAFQVRTFAAFQMIRNGKPVQFSGKAQKRPIELLLLLIAQGGRYVPTDLIMDTLWPDADGDMATSALSTTLSRLRKLIGTKDGIHLSDGKVSLDLRYLWVDAHVFEEKIRKASSLKAEGRNRDALAGFEQAIELCSGDFLPDESQLPWVIAARERLKNKLIEALKNAGRYRESTREYSKAIQWYQRGLSVDRLEEYFYQRLMLCYDRQGRYSKAIRVYERCRDALMKDLNVPPAKNTEYIYRKIRQPAKAVHRPLPVKRKANLPTSPLSQGVEKQ